MHRAPSLRWTCLLPLLAGCGSPDAGPEAGAADPVPVVERPGPGLERLWRLPTTTTHGEPLVYEPRNLAPIDADLVAVLDAADPRIVLLDRRSGGVVERFGSTGGGPGEIGGGWAVVWPDGSGRIRIADPANRRISVFSREGTLEGETPLEAEGIAWWAGIPGTGELYVQRWMLDAETGIMRHELSRVRPGSTALVHVLDLPEVPPLPADGSAGRVVFFPRPLWAVLPGGSIVTGRTDLNMLQVFDAEGRSVASFSLPYTAREVTEAVRARMTAEAGDRVPGLRRPRFYSHADIQNRMLPLSDSLVALQHSAAGRPEEMDAPGEGQVVWSLVSIHGRLLGTVAFPPGFVPHWSWEGEILGVGRDSLGVAVLEAWRVALR